ncbi:hypothetical protein WCLP8_3440005 [uncultured Gammaproteobacteria bacterium]
MGQNSDRDGIVQSGLALPGGHFPPKEPHAFGDQGLALDPLYLG